MTLGKRIERQRRLVETLERRLAFERLVLQRLEGREEQRQEAAAGAQAFDSIAEVYRAACRRAAR